jgi:cardiolipin synthase
MSLQQALDAPMIAGNRVELLSDDDAAQAAMLAALASAQDHINIEGRIADAGDGELARALLAKRAEGVHINRLPHARRKLLVVDGRLAFVGADMPVRIEGPLVAELQQLFLGHWSEQRGEWVQPAHYFPQLRAVGEQCAAIAAGAERRRPMQRALAAAIDASRRRVRLGSACFVPARPLVRALAAAARRGVDVQLMAPEIDDAWAALHAGRSHYDALLHAGVRIHEQQDALPGARAAVIDGAWSSVAALHDGEAALVVRDSEFAAALEALWRDARAHGRELSLAGWRARGLVPRLHEALRRRCALLF